MMLAEMSQFSSQASTPQLPAAAERTRAIAGRASLCAVLLLLGACVTINVYFPAAAAEQAADRFIDGVWGDDGVPGAQQAPADEQAPAADSQSQRTAPAEPALLTALGLLVDWVVPAAHAQQANIDINTPAASALQGKMRARHAKLAPHYASGAVGLTADGLVAVRDAKAVPLKQRRNVASLVAAENADREALYREVARANGHPEWREQIQATFARRWIDRAERGWYYRSSNGWSKR